MRRTIRMRVAGLSAAAIAAAFVAIPAQAQPPDPVVVGTVATDLSAPWDLAFLPGGDALVSERDSALIRRLDGAGDVTTIGQVPGVNNAGEGGLLGIAVSPTFATDGYVYAYFTASQDNRLVRMVYDGSSLGQPEVLLDGVPSGFIHNGGRITFGPDGRLYVSTGDAGQTSNAQDPTSPAGKILRLTADGLPAPDNPTPGSPVLSLGHRNVQGLGFDDAGRLWASEFGQNTWDELNLIQPGGNYGWPTCEGLCGQPGFVDPVAVWQPAEASPSGVAVAADTVWAASLRGQRLWAIPISGGEAGTPVAYFTGEFGRLRHVAEAPDGTLWLVTNNTDGRGTPGPGDDRILRLQVSETPPGGTECEVGYTSSTWPGGFSGQVAIANTGSNQVDGWTLGFDFPGDQMVSYGWNAVIEQTGSTVTARNASWNGTIAPGGSVTFGFIGTYGGSNPDPDVFTLNADPCTATP